jgi:hypothetical protein
MEELFDAVHSVSGRYVGPTSGEVIEFSRSTLSDDIMLAGRIAVGLSEPYPNYQQMLAFIDKTWRTFKRFALRGLVLVDPDTGSRVQTSAFNVCYGPDVKTWCTGSRLLKARSTQHYFIPATGQDSR